MEGQRQPHHRIGDLMIGVVVGSVGIVLDLDVDLRPLAGLERLGQGRNPLGQIVVGHLDDDAPIGQMGVVTDDQDVVGAAADVELDPVGAEGHRSGECGAGVLTVMVCSAAVGDDDGHLAAPHRHGQSMRRPGEMSPCVGRGGSDLTDGAITPALLHNNHTTNISPLCLGGVAH